MPLYLAFFHRLRYNLFHIKKDLGVFFTEEVVALEELNARFTALYEGNAAKMLRYATYQLQSHAIAEELVEEAFVRLLQRWSTLTGHPNLPGWLWKTLQHLILTEVKLAKYHREVPLELGMHAASPQTEREPLADLLPPELTPSEREVLILFYDCELTHQEMAAQLGITEMNSRTRLFRAKGHYKRILEANQISVTNRENEAI